MHLPNMNQEITQRKRFNPGLVPETVTIAKERLTELETDLNRARADLRVRGELDFAHINLYWDWRRKAEKFLRFSEAEKMFLEDWVARQHLGSTKRSHMKMLRQLVSDVLIEVSYTSVYTGDSAGASAFEAQKRRLVVACGKQKFVQTLETFDSKVQEFGFSPKDSGVQEIRKRIVKELTSMELELRLLNLTIRRSEECTNSPPIKALEPRATGVSVQDINMQVHALKVKLGMDASRMLVWLHSRIKDVSQLNLTTHEQEVFALIGDFVSVTKKRVAIEFGESP